MTIKQKLTGLLADRSGNFALIASVMAIPLVGAAGLAIDFANMSRADAALQNASDSAVLFAARYYEVNDKLPTQALVSDFLKANYKGSFEQPKFYVKNNEIFVEVKSQYNSAFMQVLSDNDPNIHALSAAPLPKDVDLEIVLSLDTTFSMTADDKIVGLRTAASNFINTMFDQANKRSRVKMALVPFAQYVNVGMGNRNASWMTVPPDQIIDKGVSCYMKQKVLSKKNCRWVEKYRDGIPYDAQVCDYEYGKPYEVCRKSTNKVKWYGCVGSRKFPTNLKDWVEDFDKLDEKFPGVMNERCQSPIAPLSGKRDEMLKQVNSLYATGETYVADGVMWGLRVLTPHAPFSEGLKKHEAKGELRKIMVLMTDGENQRSPEIPKRPNHWGTEKGKANDWTHQACQEAKKNGVEIFSITFGTSVPAAARKIIEKCASSADHYFNASDSDKLNETFAKIAATLTRVRLTH